MGYLSFIITNICLLFAYLLLLLICVSSTFSLLNASSTIENIVGLFLMLVIVIFTVLYGFGLKLLWKGKNV